MFSHVRMDLNTSMGTAAATATTVRKKHSYCKDVKLDLVELTNV